MKIKRVLISVYDKTGIEKFVKGLDKFGVEIISTGGTAEKIRSFGIKVIDISSYTGFPEMLDGRVKTLHPKIHGGLLALRNSKKHTDEIKKHGIKTIDMVVVNLYPFEEVVSDKDVTIEKAIENIDIGGPAMLRSSAKNYRSVAVVSSPAQYDLVLAEMAKNRGSVSEEVLKKLAVDVFALTSRYDTKIAAYLKGVFAKEDDPLPETINLELKKVQDLRYGENPHQRAAFYRDLTSSDKGITGIKQLQGKELSFNNILDISSAIDIVRVHQKPSAGIVKHNNPCGVAAAKDLKTAFKNALSSDPLSAFGGIISLNRAVTGDVAKTMLGEMDFFECVIAPDYDDAALELFSGRKNLRVLKMPFDRKDTKGKDFKKVRGGMLVQETDERDISLKDIKVVTKKKPSNDILEKLIFAWRVVRFVKSNAIVLCDGTRTVGIGAGQMSRVDSVTIAIKKSGKRAKGSVLASDGFFPKRDSIEKAHKTGIKAIIQPGGSIRDQEIIDACDEFGIPMVFTGIRHFRH